MLFVGFCSFVLFFLDLQQKIKVDFRRVFGALKDVYQRASSN